MQESELDAEGFDGEAYVKKCLEGQTLEELMKTYNQVLTGSCPDQYFDYRPWPN